MKIREGLFVCLLLMLAVIGMAKAQEWKLLRSGNARGVAVLPDDVLLAVINSYAYRSSDAGRTWSAGGVGPGNPTALRVKNSNEIYAGTFFGDGGLVFSTDGGNQWSYYSGLRAWDVAFNSHGHIFAATEGSEVVRSTDNGGNWTVHEVDEEGGSHYWSIAVDNQDNIYAGAQGEGVYRSTDNGETWTHLLQEAPVIADGITVAGDGTIYVSCSAGQIVFSGPNPLVGLYRSTDDGTTWQDISSEDSVYVGKRMVVDASGTLFVAATYPNDPNSVVLKSTDRGDTWQLLSGGMSWGYIFGIAMDSHGRLFTTTLGGVYSLEETSAAPETPFPDGERGVAIISGSDASGSYIRVRHDGSSEAYLQLIDLRGSERQTILLKDFSSGEHRFNIAELDLPPGIYLCRYSDGKQSTVVKVFAKP